MCSIDNKNIEEAKKRNNALKQQKVIYKYYNKKKIDHVVKKKNENEYGKHKGKENIKPVNVNKVEGEIKGDIKNKVKSNIKGEIKGKILGNVKGVVKGVISGVISNDMKAVIDGKIESDNKEPVGRDNINKKVIIKKNKTGNDKMDSSFIKYNKKKMELNNMMIKALQEIHEKSTEILIGMKIPLKNNPDNGITLKNIRKKYELNDVWNKWLNNIDNMLENE